MIELGTVALGSEDDVVIAHQATRHIASELGFSPFEQTRIATAVSEIVRNAVMYARDGSVTFGVDDQLARFTIIVADAGPGIRDLDRVLSGDIPSEKGLGLGLNGARRLMDDMDIESTPAGTRVAMVKGIPKRFAELRRDEVIALREQLSAELASQPAQEIARLERALAERDQRIADLTEELQDTNSGVMALHTELEHRAEYQRQAVELRARLLSEMGHEIRTPLHSVSAISKFLLDRLDGDLNPEQDKQVQLIHDISVNLTEYINDLLDLARTDAGRATIHMSRFEIADTLRSLQRILQPLVPPDVELQFDLEADIPPLQSDESKITQVMRNLVANALKFTERGHVRVIARHVDGDRVRIQVEDTGIGIAPEHHEHVFSEFAQAKGETPERMHGSGLGLPLSRRLAHLLGGSLEMESEFGQGSTFTFEIPRMLEGEVAEPEPSEPVHTTPSAGERTVLIIDDDEASRYILERWLNQRYRVQEAENGRQGLQKARLQPDVIFLDLIMPDMSGFDVLDKLRADPITRSIPVIVYSTLDLNQGERERLSSAVAILHKSSVSRVADRSAIEEALVRAGVAIRKESSRGT